MCTVGDGFTHKMEFSEVPFTEVLQKELLRQELKRSLKSLASGTAVSSQLKDYLEAAFDKCDESNRREYLQALQNLQGTRAPPRPPAVEPRKRRRIAGMHESWFICTFLFSGNCHSHKWTLLTKFPPQKKHDFTQKKSLQMLVLTHQIHEKQLMRRDA